MNNDQLTSIAILILSVGLALNVLSISQTKGKITAVEDRVAQLEQKK